MQIETLSWKGDVDGILEMIDQTLLPTQFTTLEFTGANLEGVWEAIHSLRVRGAPAIGIAAAYGVCIGLQNVLTETDEEAFFKRFDEVTAYLASSRPTAVNLFWALDRMKEVAGQVRGLMDVTGTFSAREVANRMLMEAQAIHEEDRRICHAIGKFGEPLIPDGAGVLTHCNAGGLATSEYGTALAVFAYAHDGFLPDIQVFFRVRHDDRLARRSARGVKPDDFVQRHREQTVGVRVTKVDLHREREFRDVVDRANVRRGNAHLVHALPVQFDVVVRQIDDVDESPGLQVAQFVERDVIGTADGVEFRVTGR